MTVAGARPSRILIIAGSDSGGGAGIQADIKTVTMLGGYAMTAVTAITAQNTLGVTGVWPLPAEAVTAQIDAVVSDIGVDAVKIGMIGSADVANAVAKRLASLDDVPIVFDPVMVATSGSMLADEATIAAFGRLMRIASVVTPNLPELAALSPLPSDASDGGEGGRVKAGNAAFDPSPSEPTEGIIAAAVRLADQYGTLVLAKGGHGAGPVITDRLISAKGVLATWEHARVETRHSHGTGCTLASGIAAGLGAGMDMGEAIGRAREYVHAALLAAPGYGAGHGPMGHTLNAIPLDAIGG